MLGAVLGEHDCALHSSFSPMTLEKSLSLCPPECLFWQLGGVRSEWVKVRKGKVRVKVRDEPRERERRWGAPECPEASQGPRPLLQP